MKDSEVLERATTTSKLMFNYEKHQSFDTPIKLIELHGDQAGGKFAIVDAEFYPLLSRHTWYLRPSGVAKSIGGDGTKLFMRRLVYGNSNQLIYHINGNQLDNRLANLAEKKTRKKIIVRSICEDPTCEELTRLSRYCRYHYRNQRKCVIDGCKEASRCNKMCMSHYQRKRYQEKKNEKQNV